MGQIGGEPLLALAARVNVGGAHMTDLLQRLLFLQQPLAYASLGAKMMAAAEALKVAHPPRAKLACSATRTARLACGRGFSKPRPQLTQVQHMYVAEDYAAEMEAFAAPRSEHGLSLVSAPPVGQMVHCIREGVVLRGGGGARHRRRMRRSRKGCAEYSCRSTHRRRRPRWRLPRTWPVALSSRYTRVWRHLTRAHGIQGRGVVYALSGGM